MTGKSSRQHEDDVNHKSTDSRDAEADDLRRAGRLAVQMALDRRDNGGEVVRRPSATGADDGPEADDGGAQAGRR